eukprot:1498402-Amphidinium_carterae.2
MRRPPSILRSLICSKPGPPNSRWSRSQSGTYSSLKIRVRISQMLLIHIASGTLATPAAALLWPEVHAETCKDIAPCEAWDPWMGHHALARQSQVGRGVGATKLPLPKPLLSADDGLSPPQYLGVVQCVQSIGGPITDDSPHMCSQPR